jgi:hypothetical protein
LEEQVSEREFNEMSIDEKLDMLQGCFGHEIRAFPPSPPTAAVTPRLQTSLKTGFRATVKRRSNSVEIRSVR